MVASRCLTWTAAMVMVCGLGLPNALGKASAAFPGAEGFGAKAKGGRGGRIIWVTNLNAHGPGSLREAIHVSGPRIIKFKVGGAIELGKRVLRLRKGLVTIDGTSAPPPGITINGNLFIRRCEEVILRNLRIRDNGFVPRSTADCVEIMASRVLIDHCSFQGARDETVSTWEANTRDVTLQWSIIGPGSGRDHATGFLAGGGSDRITVHHCLFPHNIGRNPLIAGHILTDLRNNLVYNCWNNHGASIHGGAHANVVGNLFIAGPESEIKTKPVILTRSRNYQKGKTRRPCLLYLKGNISPLRPTDDMDEWACAGAWGDWSEKKEHHGKYIIGPWKWGHKRDAPFPTPSVATHTATQARALVLSQVGAWPRDPVDAGIIRTVLHGTGHVASRNTLPSDFTNAKPIAKAGATLAPGRGHLTVNFQSDTEDRDGKIVFHTWDFGDGQRAIARNVTHTYPSGGNYTATLFVTDDQGMGATASLRISLSKHGLKAARVEPPPPTDAPAPRPIPWETPTVILDGPLTGPPNEGQWAKAPRLEPFLDQMDWWAKKTAEDLVDARVLRDREHLYVRVVAGGVRLKGMKTFDAFSAPLRRPGERAGRGVTLYISPRHGQSPWYCFELSRNGYGYDAREGDREWNPSPGWRVMSKRLGDRWCGVMAIPFRALGIRPAKASVCGLKLITHAAKNDIFIWPPVSTSDRDLMYGAERCAPQSSDPAYYAKLMFDGQ